MKPFSSAFEQGMALSTYRRTVAESYAQMRKAKRPENGWMQAAHLAD
jgi:hypothetical protein